LTGDQHTDHITNGQRVSRHSSRPDAFYFFPTAHFLKTILVSRTVKHIWFFPTHKPTQKNQKSLPLPTHDNTVNFYTIYQGNFTTFDLLKIN
jgi:hypothetical protein